MNGDARGKPADDHDDSTLPYSTEVLRNYFFGSAVLSRRSILASARSLATRSTCALRDANCSISPRTWSNGGGARMRLSSTFRTCQRSEERRVGEEGRSRWSPDH